MAILTNKYSLTDLAEWGRMEDRFRSPIDPLGLFQQWWGEPLSHELVERAANAPSAQQHEFLDYATTAPPAEIPDLDRGKLRPLVVNDGFHFGDLADYYSAAVTLALYADEVAVEYRFWNNELDPLDFRYMLECLLLLKPLADHGIMRFFAPDIGMHNYGAFQSEWDNLVGNSDLGKADWEQLGAAVTKFAPFGHHMSSYTACFLVASQLAAKSATPEKFSLLVRSDPERIVFEALADLSKSLRVDGRGYAMAKLVGLRVPSYSLDTSTLATLRLSGSAFADWRSALRNALSDINGLPDGTPEWQHEAREIASGELLPLQAKIERATQASPVLIEAVAGFRALVLSGVGAATAASFGGDFRSEFAGAAATGLGQIAFEYWEAVKHRNELRALKDVILAFTRQ
jgi:hypothetical protein